MLYLLLRRWSISFELFFPEISAGEPQTTYATCMHATFRLLFRSNIQISKGSFQSLIFTLPVFLGIPRARGDWSQDLVAINTAAKRTAHEHKI